MTFDDRREKTANAVRRIAEVSAELHLTLNDLEHVLDVLRNRTYITTEFEPFD